MNTDPYNWPFPQRSQTMALSTLSKIFYQLDQDSYNTTFSKR